MYFDVHTQPDWWRRAFVLRAALDELDFPNRPAVKSWRKRAAVLAAIAVIILVLLVLASPA